MRLEVKESGVVILDTNVSDRLDRAGNDHLMDSFVLAEEDIEAGLRSAFSFVGALYARFDPYKRHQRFLVNACLVGIGHRKLIRNPKPQGSYGSNLFGIEQAVAAYDAPRVVTRSDLADAAAEVDRFMAKFRRAVKAAESPG